MNGPLGLIESKDISKFTFAPFAICFRQLKTPNIGHRQERREQRRGGERLSPWAQQFFTALKLSEAASKHPEMKNIHHPTEPAK